MGKSQRVKLELAGMSVKDESRSQGGSMVTAPLIYAQTTANKRAETRGVNRRGKS